MSGQDDYLSGQNLGLAVILTGHIRDFKAIKRKKLFALSLENVNSYMYHRIPKVMATRSNVNFFLPSY